MLCSRDAPTAVQLAELFQEHRLILNNNSEELCSLAHNENTHKTNLRSCHSPIGQYVVSFVFRLLCQLDPRHTTREQVWHRHLEHVVDTSSKLEHKAIQPKATDIKITITIVCFQNVHQSCNYIVFFQNFHQNSNYLFLFHFVHQNYNYIFRFQNFHQNYNYRFCFQHFHQNSSYILFFQFFHQNYNYMCCFIIFIKMLITFFFNIFIKI